MSSPSHRRVIAGMERYGKDREVVAKMTIWVGKLAGAPKRNPSATEHEDGDEERLAHKRERKRWCSWTCSSTTAADDGCTRRITASSKFEARRKTRRRERGGALLSVTLRGAPPRREKRERKRETRRTDRPTDRSIIACLGC